jgi:hypothetical protein
MKENKQTKKEFNEIAKNIKSMTDSELLATYKANLKGLNADIKDRNTYLGLLELTEYELDKRDIKLRQKAIKLLNNYFDNKYG